MNNDKYEDEHFLPEGDEDFGKKINGVRRELIDDFGEDRDINLLNELLYGFSEEEMKDFVEKLGYRVIPRYDPITEENYYVAISPDSPSLPSLDSTDEDLENIFIKEVKACFLRMLLNNGRKETIKRSRSKGTGKVGSSN